MDYMFFGVTLGLKKSFLSYVDGALVFNAEAQDTQSAFCQALAISRSRFIPSFAVRVFMRCSILGFVSIRNGAVAFPKALHH